MSKLLSKDEWDIVCFIEEQHVRKGKFPSVRFISHSTGIDQLKVVEALKSPLVRQSLEARGINWNPVSKTDRLTPEQIAAITLLIDISDRRNIKEKLASLGLTYSRFYGWKKQPHFMEAYREASEKLYAETLPEVHKSVIQEAVNGSYQHQKLMLAISGRWDEKKQAEEMNVKYVLMRVLEILQIHVRDPETLQAIAGEFETLLNPDKPKAITSAQPMGEDD